MARLRWPLAGFLVIFLSGAILAQVQKRAASPARFDYYALSLSWAPEYCTQPGVAAGATLECAKGRDIGFVVHGLWPEVNEGKAPESCGPAKAVAKAVTKFILPYMPGKDLIQQDWATHGTCTGLTPSDYFATVLQARSTVQIPIEITSIEEPVRESPADIEARFTASNPAFPMGSFRAVCRNGALAEVRVCFDKDLKPRMCAPGAGDCASTSVTISPPR